MHYTPAYTDRTAKAEAVQANTVEMMAEFIRNRLVEAGFTTRNVNSSMEETRDILREWVEHHPDATLEAVSDQVSDMVRDHLDMAVAEFTAMDPNGLLDDDKDAE